MVATDYSEEEAANWVNFAIESMIFHPQMMVFVVTMMEIVQLVSHLSC